jgi:hypothetical protein
MLIGVLLAGAATSLTGQFDYSNLPPASGLPVLMVLLLPFAVLAVPFVDLLMAVVRRTRAGRSPFAADKQHLHHRLLEIGHSPHRAVLIMYFWTALLALRRRSPSPSAARCPCWPSPGCSLPRPVLHQPRAAVRAAARRPVSAGAPLAGPWARRATRGRLCGRFATADGRARVSAPCSAPRWSLGSWPPACPAVLVRGPRGPAASGGVLLLNYTFRLAAAVGAQRGRPHGRGRAAVDRLRRHRGGAGVGGRAGRGRAGGRP